MLETGELGSNLGPNLGPNQLATGTAIDPPPADFNIPTSNFHCYQYHYKHGKHNINTLNNNYIDF